MGVKFSIWKDGKEVSRKEAVDLLGYSTYSPDGSRSADSDYYLMEVCYLLQKQGLIDRYEMEGEPDPLPDLPDDPDIIY